MSSTPIHDPITDHSYDGIQEYDNPLPGWWKFLFVLSFVFAPIYWAYFHLGTTGRSIHDEYEQSQARYYESQFKEIGELEKTRKTMALYMTDPDKSKYLKVGAAVFKQNCSSCHGQNGEGLVGTNLTDESWKNVTQLEDIISVIENGANNGAMPAWKNRLNNVNKVVLTAAYVASLRGKGSGGGKAAEGKPIPPWNLDTK